MATGGSDADAAPALGAPVILTPPAAGNGGVTATNDSATATKVHAVNLGYYSDPYALRLGELSAPQPKPPPMISRGYFARVRFVERAVDAFAARHAAYQVVSLGCGYDSAYFRIVASATPTASTRGLRKWVDVDFAEVILPKHRRIARDPEMTALAARDGGRYALVALDLREADFAEKLRAGLREVGADVGLPTLVLSECVLIYLDPAEGDAVIRAFSDTFPTAAFVTYEQIHPSTPFGQRMVDNLTARGCPLRALAAYPSLAAQEARYKALGFPDACCKTMNTAWEAIPVAERQRASRVEFLDELEEWTLIHDHYCFACASKGMDTAWCTELFARARMVVPGPGGRPLLCAD